MNTVIKLTPFQASFLDDRPGECVVDCMSQIFPAASDDDLCKASDKIEQFFGRNLKNYKETYKPRPIDVSQLSELERETLIDYLQGSTVCGCLLDLKDYGGKSEALAYYRAKRTLHVLVEKFRSCGLNVTFIPDA